MVIPIETFNYMKGNFNQEACKTFTKPISFEYNIGGDDGGVWHFHFDGKGNCELLEGPAEKAIIAYNFSNAKDFDKVIRGEISGLQAYTQGIVKVKGPIGIAQKFDEVFKKE